MKEKEKILTTLFYIFIALSMLAGIMLFIVAPYYVPKDAFLVIRNSYREIVFDMQILITFLSGFALVISFIGTAITMQLQKIEFKKSILK